jgi:hypothetical protein
MTTTTTEREHRWAGAIAAPLGVLTGFFTSDILRDFGVGSPARYFILFFVIAATTAISYRAITHGK